MKMSSLVEVAPKPIERLGTASYYWYQSKKADRSHEEPAETIEKQDDSPQHVIILVIDALRPDFEPDIGVEFGRAITPGTWTFPAVTSLLSGQYPHEHEAVAHTHPNDESYVMPEQAAPTHTLPGVLEAAGYDTYGGFAFMTPFLAAQSWFQTHRVYQDCGAARVLEEYKSWRSSREQTFGYLHLGDLHAPITPPSEYIKSQNVDMSIEGLPRLTHYTDTFEGTEEQTYFREERLKLYQAALDYLEDVLEEFIEQFNDDTAVLITGDHGEAHWEHYELDRRFTDSRPNYGVGHGGTPFDMVARVPVSFQTPTELVIPRGGTASLCDIPATVGQELLSENPFNYHVWQDPIPQYRTVYCEATRYGAERKAAYQDDVKVIHGKTDSATLAAHVEPDSGEVFDEELISETEIGENLRSSLPDYWKDGNINSNTSRMVENQLSALGYK